MLRFLVPKHCDAAIAETLSTERFAEDLLVEIRRFVTVNRPVASESDQYLAQLSNRLSVLRSFYCITSVVTLPVSAVEALWSALADSPAELEQLFLFLKLHHSTGTNHLSMNTSPSASICTPLVAAEVFRRFLCSAEVDWALCGPGAMESFHGYFAEVDLGPGRGLQDGDDELQQALLRCGLETLWRIALHIESPSAAEEATEWLVEAHNSMAARGNTAAYSELLAEVFTHLGEVQAQLAVSKILPSSAQQRLSRCVHILQTAVLKSKGAPSVAHSVRGTMSRMSVTVCYRRVSPYYHQGMQATQLRSDKGFEGSVVLEVHSCFSVLQLKEKLLAATSIHAEAHTIAVENSRGVHCGDSMRLFELGVTDGSDVSVSYQTSYSHHSNKSFDAGDNYFSSEHSSPVSRSAVRQEGSNVGLLLASDYSQFDCLLTLCDLSGDEVATKLIWDLLMLLPTQCDLNQQTLEQVCFSDASVVSDAGLEATGSWSAVLVSCSSVARTAYLLQIIDSFLQPAPELIDEGADGLDGGKARIFRESFVASGGFGAVLQILLSTPTGLLVTNSTALAVALHIIHFLLFGQDPAAYSALEGGLDDDSLDCGLGESSVFPSVAGDSVSPSVGGVPLPPSELLEAVELQLEAVLEKLMQVAKSAADRE